MNIVELKQIKQDVANGILISKETWLKVLDASIESKNFKDGQQYDFASCNTIAVDAGDAKNITVIGYNQNGELICERVSG